MNINTFPGCCTARILIGLPYSPEDDPDMTEYEETYLYWFNCLYQELLERAVQHSDGVTIPVAIDGQKRFIDSYGRTLGIMSATTTDNQEMGNRILERLGFVGSEFISKQQHSDTKVKIWYIPMRDLCKNVLKIKEMSDKKIEAFFAEDDK